MKQDVFEWDDATQKIVEKAVESRELDNATENLKEQAEESIDKDFHQFNFDEILRDRDTVVKSIQQVLSPRLNSFEKREEQIQEREDESSFQANYRDNAVDTDDYDRLKNNYSLLKEIHSQTTIWAFVAHANSSDVAKALDIRQMQADQNEAMKMVNENYEKFEGAADRIARQVRTGIEDGMKNALEETVEADREKVKELERKNEELRKELEEEREKGVELDDPQPLTSKQAELADLVEDNPGKDIEEIAEELDTPKNKVRQMESRIRDKGYKFSID